MQEMNQYFQIENGVLLRYTGREEELQVPEGIHTVGEGAFKGCVSLRKVVLPAGLYYIMGDAFKGCRKLEEVVIPDGVRAIGRYAFHRCHALKRAILPCSVEELGECAFLYCDSMEEVQMPGVKRFGMEALANGTALQKLVISRELDEHCICDVFTGCGRVREIRYADGETFCIPNVVDAAAGACSVPPLIALVVRDILERMMELEGRTLVRFRVNIKHIEVPEGIEVLGKSSFYDLRGIVDIRLPKSLRKIESRAFRNCIGLEEVVLGGDGVQIDEDAFRNCTSLKTVRTCDGAVYTFEGLADIYRQQEPDTVKSLVSVKEIPEPVRAVRRQVFGNFRLSGTILLQYLGAESRVVIPEGITAIAQEAFAGIETIDKVILPESLQEIGAEAFRGCLMMQTAVLPEGLCRIGAGAFSDCVKLLRVAVPNQIQFLENRVFRGCRALQEVSLPEGLCRIGESAFYGCTGLKKLALPESLVYIGKMAFYRAGLREVRIPAKTAVVESLAFAKSLVQKAWISGGGDTGKAYGAGIFRDCMKLKLLFLEEGVCHIPDQFAYGCTALGRVVLPKSLQSVGRHAFEGKTQGKQQRYSTRAAVLHDAYEKEWDAQHFKEMVSAGDVQAGAVFWDGQDLEGEVWIPENVGIIAGGAFYGNTKITTVHLPAGVTSVGAAAFKGCKLLRHVYLPSAVTCLEAEVFSGCEALEEVLTSDQQELVQWQAIGVRAFYQCRNLRRIRLEQAQSIGREALCGCALLAESAVHPALTAGERAFAGTVLGRTLENGIRVVGNLVVSLEACADRAVFAEQILLPDFIRGIAPYAFAGNHDLCKVILPAGVRWIGEGAFFGCSSLEAVDFVDGQQLLIGANAFEKCIHLKEIRCSAQAIGEAAFAGCIALCRAVLLEAMILEKRLFAGCTDLAVCRCENAKVVKAYCFSGCKHLQEFDFAPFDEIGEYAFEGCEALKYAAFQDGVCLSAHAMEDCSGLEKICLSGQQGRICLKEYALSGCTALSRIVWQGTEWTFRCYQDILSEEIPEMVRRLFQSALSCFTVLQEEHLVRYRGAASVVRIPSGIRRIEAEVFRDAMMLEQVEIPESVEHIGARAFHGTPWIAKQRRETPLVIVRDMLLDGSASVGEVVIPDSVRLVCGWAFANGLDITGICFPRTDAKRRFVQVEEYAFRNCINLRKMRLPDGETVQFTGLADRERALPPLAKQAVMDSLNCFKTDEHGVLRECTGNIARFRLAHGITEIGEGTFQDGNLLTAITFSETVASIGAHAFAGCKWLREVWQAGSVTSIGAHAFFGCGALRCVEFSENLQQIGAHAFENCTSLEEIRIPEGVEEIPERAFYRCHMLKKITLPATLKKIGKEAFAYCGGTSEMQMPAGVQVGE